MTRRLDNPRSTPPIGSQEQELLDLQAIAELPRLLPYNPAEPRPRVLPPVSRLQQRNTSRLLPARYSDSVLTRLTEDAQDLASLFTLDNATNERLLTEVEGAPGLDARELVFDLPFARIINAAFAHPHPLGARFSTSDRGAWYAAFELVTAKAEVLFHRSVQLSEIHWQAPEALDYDHYIADFAGDFHDLREHDLREHDLREVSETPPTSTELEQLRTATLAPDSYIASQRLAIDLLAARALGIIYPSTRRSGGTCIACFRPAAVTNVRKRELYRLTWYPDRPATFRRIPRSEALAL